MQCSIDRSSHQQYSRPVVENSGDLASGQWTVDFGRNLSRDRGDFQCSEPEHPWLRREQSCGCNNDSWLQRRVKATSCQPGTIVTIGHSHIGRQKPVQESGRGDGEPRTHEDSELIKTVTQNPDPSQGTFCSSGRILPSPPPLCRAPQLNKSTAEKVTQPRHFSAGKK